MGVSVPLDAALFRELYPKFAKSTDAQITQWWGVACVLIDNSPGSRIPYDPPVILTRRVILYAALCHLAALDSRAGLVGRMQSAAEGSVNAGFTYTDRANAAWWNQTQCGATVWQMLKPWRTGGLYFSGRRCRG